MMMMLADYNNFDHEHDNDDAGDELGDDYIDDEHDDDVGDDSTWDLNSPPWVAVHRISL